MTDATAAPTKNLNKHPATTDAVHTRNGETIPGSDVIMQVLADEGVDTIFGYSGGAILPTYDAIFRFNRDELANIKLIVPANEQGAGFMAAGYSRASGRVGVCMVTSGPGATNCVTPIRDCMADSIPMVLICGQVPTSAIGTDGFQEAPIPNIMSACAKHCFLVTDPKKLESTVRTAFELARTGRPGPVVIDVPKDIQNAAIKFDGQGVLPIPGYRQRMERLASQELSEEKIQKFFELLAQAERPLLYVGGGAVNGNFSEQLRSFADEFGIPAVNTLMGIGAIDTTTDKSMHMLGMHGAAYANYAVDDCDLLIAVGARFDDRVAGNPSKFAPNAKAIAHFDIDESEIGKVKQVDWHYVGETAPALIKLTAYGKNNFNKSFTPWHEHCADLKKTYDWNYDKDSQEIQPYEVIEKLNNITKGEAIVSTGVGQHQMWAAQYFDFKEPRQWLTSGSMGTMGFGLPAAIGAQFACPDKLVIDVDGDGSIRMNLGDLETATTYNLPVKVLLLNNYGDGMVRQWQKLFFDSRFAASDKQLHKKDFIKAAEADGFEFAVRVDKKEDLEAQLKAFVEFDGPSFLEVIIDGDAGVYPMVGPGASYAEMITGDWIKSRDSGGSEKQDSSSVSLF